MVWCTSLFLPDHPMHVIFYTSSVSSTGWSTMFSFFRIGSSRRTLLQSHTMAMPLDSNSLLTQSSGQYSGRESLGLFCFQSFVVLSFFLISGQTIRPVELHSALALDTVWWTGSSASCPACFDFLSHRRTIRCVHLLTTKSFLLHFHRRSLCHSFCFFHP